MSSIHDMIVSNTTDKPRSGNDEEPKIVKGFKQSAYDNYKQQILIICHFYFIDRSLSRITFLQSLRSHRLKGH